MAILATERLILRDFAPSDWDTLNALVSDPAVTRFMHFASWGEEKRYQWLARMVQEASTPHPYTDNWAIALRSNGLLIGWLFIGSSREVAEAGRRGCGYALEQHFWGQGYMTEALPAAFGYEFTVVGTQSITAECETANIASARVMQKSGIAYEGTFSDADFEGNWAERHHYKISSPSSTRLDRA
jgi:[ribosomal protein S5]-alanine N-acetyltransferase